MARTSLSLKPEAATTILREISETVGARRGAILVHDRVTDTLQRVVSLCPDGKRRALTVAFAQSLRLIVNQRLVPSTDGRRTPLREFLVFDTALRRRFLDADPDRWPVLAQDVLDAGAHGQSFGVAVRRALAEGRITADEAHARLKEWGYVA